MPGKHRKAAGCTMISKNKKLPILILINPGIPVYGAVEVLAHEIAHVIALPHEAHGKPWKDAFNAIHKEYCKRVFLA